MVKVNNVIIIRIIFLVRCGQKFESQLYKTSNINAYIIKEVNSIKKSSGEGFISFKGIKSTSRHRQEYDIIASIIIIFLSLLYSLYSCLSKDVCLNFDTHFTSSIMFLISVGISGILFINLEIFFEILETFVNNTPPQNKAESPVNILKSSIKSLKPTA